MSSSFSLPPFSSSLSLLPISHGFVAPIVPPPFLTSQGVQHNLLRSTKRPPFSQHLLSFSFMHKNLSVLFSQSSFPYFGIPIVLLNQTSAFPPFYILMILPLFLIFLPEFSRSFSPRNLLIIKLVICYFCLYVSQP